MADESSFKSAGESIGGAIALVSTIENHCACFWQTEFTANGDMIRRNTGRGLELMGIRNADTIGTRADDWPGIDYYWKARKMLIDDPSLPYVVFDASQIVYGEGLDTPPLTWLASITRWFEEGKFVGLSILQIAHEWGEPL